MWRGGGKISDKLNFIIGILSALSYPLSIPRGLAALAAAAHNRH